MAFQVGVTSDLFDQRGEPTFGASLESTRCRGLGKAPARPARDHAGTCRRIRCPICELLKVSARVVETPNLRLKLVSRHGVGYDSVDVPAMTRAGVLVANTPNAVPRPADHRAYFHPRALAPALRQGPPHARRPLGRARGAHGHRPTGRTLGVVGAGGIGKSYCAWRVFDLRLLAADPYVDSKIIEGFGAKRVALDDLMAQSDFVVVACLLNDETRHLIARASLGA